ncbi:unnamed protein product [Sphagnum troendelagicum]|uniref:Reverse transcriptase domain-containing protein n=1 Tax=Sphagnum troendelagicum TaxID=128251 RepID=A0ABP0UBJ9_9BRYO
MAIGTIGSWPSTCSRVYKSLHGHQLLVGCGMQIPYSYGVLAYLINLLKDLYLGTQVIVQLDGHLGRNFLVTSGVGQGCVAIPLLFNVFLDFIVKEALKALLDYGVEVEFWFGGELLYTLGSGPLSLAIFGMLLYVDDMVMFSTNVGKLVKMLRVVDF